MFEVRIIPDRLVAVGIRPGSIITDTIITNRIFVTESGKAAKLFSFERDQLY
jgi:hypothetical protein